MLLDISIRAKIVGLVTAFLVLILLGVYTHYALGVIKDEELMETYYDQNLNYSIKLPNNFSVGIPSEKYAKELVHSSKKDDGLLFNLYEDKLEEEVFSFLGVDKTDPSIKPFKRFILITFKGLEDKQPNNKYEELAFGKLLSLSGIERVKITRDFSTGKPLKATGVVDEKTIYFTHQKKEMGKNIMTITYGDISSRNKGDKEIETILDSISFTVKEDNPSEDFNSWLEDHYDFIEDTRKNLK